MQIQEKVLRICGSKNLELGSSFVRLSTNAKVVCIEEAAHEDLQVWVVPQVFPIQILADQLQPAKKNLNFFGTTRIVTQLGVLKRLLCID